MDSLPSSRHTGGAVPKFATGANGIPVPVRPPLGNDIVEPRAEPEGDTTLARVLIQVVGAGNPLPGDILSTANGTSLIRVTTPMEGQTQIAPKSGSRMFCEQCPELPSFASKNALRKHRKQAHFSPAPQCPVCRGRVPKQHLAKHLKRKHGITNAALEINPPTAQSVPTYANDATRLLQISHNTNDTATFNTNESTSGRVYCQEPDCGRGFSSETYLGPHTKFFHQGEPKQIEGEKEPASPSKDVTERSAGPRSHQGPLNPSIPGSALPHAGERADDRDLRPSGGTGVSQPGSGCQGVDPVVENSTKETGIAVESPPSIEGIIDTVTQPKTAPPTLPLNCRVCNAPPTVTTQPAVTTCGHLFCIECIAQHVSSTSRCPVCNSSLLLYCIFKLDLSGMS